MLSQLNDIRANLSRLAGNGGPADELVARIASGVANLRADAAGLPQPFARMMDDAGADISREIADSNVAGALSTLREKVTLVCQDKIAGRYPFAKGAEREVDLDDFARMFGPKGLIDQFVGAYVLASVDASGPQWKWRDDSPLASKLTPTSLADFALAADIRAAFFGPGQAAPGFSYTVTPPGVSRPASRDRWDRHHQRLRPDEPAMAGRERKSPRGAGASPERAAARAAIRRLVDLSPARRGQTQQRRRARDLLGSAGANSPGASARRPRRPAPA